MSDSGLIADWPCPLATPPTTSDSLADTFFEFAQPMSPSAPRPKYCEDGNELYRGTRSGVGRLQIGSAMGHHSSTDWGAGVRRSWAHPDDFEAVERRNGQEQISCGASDTRQRAAGENARRGRCGRASVRYACCSSPQLGPEEHRSYSASQSFRLVAIMEHVTNVLSTVINYWATVGC